jgi:hypothetical protein
MIETNRALLMELIVLSTYNEKQIPSHIDWLLKELTVNFLLFIHCINYYYY